MVNETMNKPTEIYNHTIIQQAIKIGKMKLFEYCLNVVVHFFSSNTNQRYWIIWSPDFLMDRQADKEEYIKMTIYCTTRKTKQWFYKV